MCIVLYYSIIVIYINGMLYYQKNLSVFVNQNQIFWMLIINLSIKEEQLKLIIIIWIINWHLFLTSEICACLSTLYVWTYKIGPCRQDNFKLNLNWDMAWLTVDEYSKLITLLLSINNENGTSSGLIILLRGKIQ